MILQGVPVRQLEFFETEQGTVFTPKQKLARWKKFNHTYFTKELELVYYHVPGIVKFVYANNSVVTVKGKFAEYLTQ